MNLRFKPTVIEGDSFRGYQSAFKTTLITMATTITSQQFPLNCFGYLCKSISQRDIQAQDIVLGFGVLVSPFHVLTAASSVTDTLRYDSVTFVSRNDYRTNDTSHRVLSAQKLGDLVLCILEEINNKNIKGSIPNNQFIGIINGDQAFFNEVMFKQMEVLAFDEQNYNVQATALIVDTNRQSLIMSLTPRLENPCAIVLNHPSFGYVLIGLKCEYDGLYHRVITIPMKVVDELMQFQDLQKKENKFLSSNENNQTYQPEDNYLEKNCIDTNTGEKTIIMTVEEPAEYEKKQIICLKQLNCQFMITTYFDGSASFWHIGSLNVGQVVNIGMLLGNAAEVNRDQGRVKHYNNKYISQDIITDIVNEGYLAIALIANNVVLINWLDVQCIDSLQFSCDLTVIIKREYQPYCYYLGDSQGSVYIIRFNVESMRLELMNHSSPVIQLTNTNGYPRVKQLLLMPERKKNIHKEDDNQEKINQTPKLAISSNLDGMHVYEMSNNDIQVPIEQYGISHNSIELLGYSNNQLVVSSGSVLLVIDSSTGRMIFQEQFNNTITCGVFLNENELVLAETTNIHVVNIITRQRNSYCYHKDEISHVMRIKSERGFVSVDKSGVMYKWKSQRDCMERKNRFDKNGREGNDELEEEELMLQYRFTQGLNKNNSNSNIYNKHEYHSFSNDQVIRLFSSVNPIDKQTTVVSVQAQNIRDCAQPQYKDEFVNNNINHNQTNLTYNNTSYLQDKHNNNNANSSSIMIQISPKRGTTTITSSQLPLSHNNRIQQQTSPNLSPSKSNHHHIDANIDNMKQQLSEMKDRLSMRRNRLSEREANSNKKEEGFKATMGLIQNRSSVKTIKNKNDIVNEWSNDKVENDNNSIDKVSQQIDQTIQLSKLILQGKTQNNNSRNLEIRTSSIGKPKINTTGIQSQYRVLSQQVADLQQQMAEISIKGKGNCQQDMFKQDNNGDIPSIITKTTITPTSTTANTSPLSYQHKITGKQNNNNIINNNNLSQSNNNNISNPYFLQNLPVSSIPNGNASTYQQQQQQNSFHLALPQPNSSIISTPSHNNKSKILLQDQSPAIRTWSLSPIRTVNYYNCGSYLNTPMQNVSTLLRTENNINSNISQNIFVTPVSKPQLISQSKSASIRSLSSLAYSSPAGSQKLQVQKQQLLYQQSQLQAQAVYLQQQQQKKVLQLQTIGSQQQQYNNQQQITEMSSPSVIIQATPSRSSSRLGEVINTSTRDQSDNNNNNTLSPVGIYGQSQQLSFQKINNKEKGSLLQLTKLDSSEQQQQYQQQQQQQLSSISTGLFPSSSYTGGTRSSILLMNSPMILAQNSKQTSQISNATIKADVSDNLAQQKEVEELKRQLEQQAMLLKEVQEQLKKSQIVGDDNDVGNNNGKQDQREQGKEKEQLLQENILLKNQLAIAQSDLKVIHSNNNNNNQQVNNPHGSNSDYDPLGQLIALGSNNSTHRPRNSNTNGKAPRAPSYSNKGRQSQQSQLGQISQDKDDNNKRPAVLERIYTYDSQNSMMNTNKHNKGGYQQQITMHQHDSQVIKNSHQNSFEGSIETIKTFDPDDSRMNGKHNFNNNNNNSVNSSVHILKPPRQRRLTADSELVLLNQQLNGHGSNQMNNSRKQSFQTLESIRTFNPEIDGYDGYTNNQGIILTKDIYQQHSKDEIIEKQYDSRLIKEGDSIKSFNPGGDISEDNESDYYPSSYQILGKNNNVLSRNSKGRISKTSLSERIPDRQQGKRQQQEDQGQNGLCAQQ